MAEGFTTVSAEHLTDSSGNVVVDATISFQPCDSEGKPCSCRAYPKGQVMFQPVKATVTDGVFSIPLADTALTEPTIAYSVRVIDNRTGNPVLGPTGYMIQPSGDTWDFDQFQPEYGAGAQCKPIPNATPSDT